MISGIKTLGALALVLAGAIPAAADVTTMTCGDFMTLDSVSKQTMAGEILKWLADVENTAKSPDLVAKYATPTEGEKWGPEDLVIEIEGHCQDAPSSVGVLARLEEHS